MNGPSLERVTVWISMTDQTEFDRLRTLLEAQLNQPSNPAPARTLYLLEIEHQELLGAFETVFLIGMGVGVALSGSAIGAWCLANRGRRIHSDSREAQVLIGAVVASTEPEPNKDAAKSTKEDLEPESPEG